MAGGQVAQHALLGHGQASSEPHSVVVVAEPENLAHFQLWPGPCLRPGTAGSRKHEPSLWQILGDNYGQFVLKLRTLDAGGDAMVE